VITFAPDSEAERDFEALVSWLEEIYVPPAPLVEVTAGSGGRAAELARRVGVFTEPTEDSPVVGRIMPQENFDAAKF